ncbi:hypothetical protein GCM10010149_44420 [Nonomuraea roseoviolacea subsp. roseoviolacea]|uniref:PASTA domain-containing protein n=1 Tax=Nonomuraea roseoviolacea subsp. carminata TaxID=160689 RepID=A0ABT1JZ52_9ACTN|nr:hypothetical protein [Nonomuraea roseoviolacea]MCP2347006.1 hypothetical protein [Nonomuraea roseoviolacea subsp. carminata]
MNLADVARVHDKDLAGEVAAPEAQGLMHAIMSEEREQLTVARPRRKVRRGLVLGLAATATAVAIAVGAGLPGGPATSYANAAVSIEKTDEYFSVNITDPTADRRRFEEAFRAVGLNVTVKVVPVAPSEVGKLIGPIVPDGFTWHGSIGTQSIEPCSSAFCAKVWMPADFPGRVVFGVGRPAKPGEPYADEAAVDPAGEEALSGYVSRGKTVADVRAELRRRGLKTGYRLVWQYPDGGFFDEAVPANRVKDHWTVASTRPHSSDTVDLYVTPGKDAGPAPSPHPQPEWYDMPD